MPKALVTGASGFVGKYLVAYLHALGYLVYAGSRNRETTIHPEGVISFSLDITDENKVEEQIREIKPDEIYHLAAIAHPISKNIQPFYDVNFQGTLNILEAARKINSAVLVVSSAYAYGCYNIPIKENFQLAPVNHYGISKAGADMLGYSYALQGEKVVRVRPFNHSGPEQLPTYLLPTLVNQLAKIEMGVLSPTIKLGNLDAVRDFMDVRDVVRTYPLLLKHGINGEAYNVCSGKPISVKELFDLVASLSSVKVKLEIEEFRKRKTDISYLVGDTSKLRTLIDWKPEIELEETIRDMLNHYKEDASSIS